MTRHQSNTGRICTIKFVHASKSRSLETALRNAKTAAMATTMGMMCLVTASCTKSNPSVLPPPHVAVSKVLERRIQDWDEFTGRFQAVEKVEIRPRVSGYVDRVALAEGKIVNQGDLLFVVDPRPYQADYDRAKAALELARAQLDLAQIELDRVQKLKASGAVSREELDERQSAVNQRKANIQAQKASVDAAALSLSFTQVKSPVYGRASRAEVTKGNLVTGGNTGGTLLTTVVSLDPIYVYFEGDENAYLRYKKGIVKARRQDSVDTPKNLVRVGLADEKGFPYEGTIDFVDNVLNPTTGTIRARAVFANKEGIFTPGLFARIQLMGSTESNAILVDDGAIASDQNQKYVLVLDSGNKVAYRKVTLGRMMDGLRIVRDGLVPGDVIVVNGLQRARPGTVVEPEMVSMSASGAVSSAPGVTRTTVFAKTAETAKKLSASANNSH